MEAPVEVKMTSHPRCKAQPLVLLVSSPAGSMTADTCGRGSSSTHAGNRCLTWVAHRGVETPPLSHASAAFFRRRVASTAGVPTVVGLSSTSLQSRLIARRMRVEDT